MEVNSRTLLSNSGYNVKCKRARIKAHTARATQLMLLLLLLPMVPRASRARVKTDKGPSALVQGVSLSLGSSSITCWLYPGHGDASLLLLGNQRHPSSLYTYILSISISLWSLHLRTGASFRADADQCVLYEGCCVRLRIFTNQRYFIFFSYFRLLYSSMIFQIVRAFGKFKLVYAERPRDMKFSLKALFFGAIRGFKKIIICNIRSSGESFDYFQESWRGIQKK